MPRIMPSRIFFSCARNCIRLPTAAAPHNKVRRFRVFTVDPTPAIVLNPGSASSTIEIMLKSWFSLALATLLLVAAGSAQTDKKSAFDQSYLELFARHWGVFLRCAPRRVGNENPSEPVPGMQEVHVKIARGPASG